MSIWKSKKEKPSQPEEDSPSIIDFAMAEDQLANLRASQGMEDTQKHGPIWHLIDSLLTRQAERVKQPVKKKTYLWLCLLGAFGAHRFYSKRWVLGLIYLLTCWTGWSIAMTIIDVMVAIPMKADENGVIYI